MTTTHTKHRNLAKKQRAFTLIELLLVIGIIAILMAIVILAVNPRLQLSKAEDARRNVQAREIKNALMQYQVDNGFVPNGVTTTPTPICAYRAPSASGCIVLDTLIDENYLVTFTPDIAEVDSNRLGYSVAQVTTGQVVVTPVHLSTATATASALSAPLVATVVNRQLFYNQSAFDGNDAAINASDDGAIATDKYPLLPGQTASFPNYASYSRGINGLIIDITGLASTPSLSTINDYFSFKVGRDNDPSGWNFAPAPTAVFVRTGQGLNSSDRVVITWSNSSIRNTWLEVIVKSNGFTNLPNDDRFYFGNAVGETGDSPANANVNATDVARAQSNFTNFRNPATVTNLFDIDRDRGVVSTDITLIQLNYTNFLTVLPLITAG